MRLLQSRFKLKPSAVLGVISSLSHIGAVFSICFIPIFVLAKIALTFCIITSFVVVIRIYVLLYGDRTIIEFWPDREGAWCLKRNSSELVSAVICYPVFVSSYIIIINFTLKGKWLKISVPICKDALAGDDFRKLKMLLRIGGRS